MLRSKEFYSTKIKYFIKESLSIESIFPDILNYIEVIEDAVKDDLFLLKGMGIYKSSINLHRFKVAIKGHVKRTQNLHYFTAEIIRLNDVDNKKLFYRGPFDKKLL